MTLKDFLETVFIADHEDEARYPDGTGGRDEFHMFMHMQGHGELIYADVTEVRVGRGMMFVTLQGEEGDMSANDDAANGLSDASRNILDKVK